MTSTMPTTLHDYQEYVRKEALKIQADMNWPDEKLNETLRNLGLPEKRTFLVPLEITGRMLTVLPVVDADSEEEARAQVAAKTPAELRQLVGRYQQLGYFDKLGFENLDALPTAFEVGDLDSTITNPAVYHAASGDRAQCENTHRDGTTGYHYCSRQRGHEGQHAQGDGRTITAVWDA